VGGVIKMKILENLNKISRIPIFATLIRGATRLRDDPFLVGDLK
jgi:hypothetical protein